MDGLWNDNRPDKASDEPLLNVDVDGFEGPLDLLLHLARNQKVDLTRISVLALAEQYLTFIEQVRALRLEIAADYLVMAAWLAFLKSAADTTGWSGRPDGRRPRRGAAISPATS
jgi:segregation and condensation protein A